MASDDLKILSADWVIPVKGDPIPGGAVAIESGLIRFAGTSQEAASLFPGAHTTRLNGKRILPGLINAHCHLDNCFLADKLSLSPEETFFDWIARMISEQERHSLETKKKAALQGISQLVKSGTVAIGDITHDPFTAPALEEAGLEAVFFHEAIGFLPEEAERVYEEKLEAMTALKKTSKSEHFISPHSPYSVSRDLLKKIASRSSRVSFHLAESRDEVEFLKKGHPKMEAILKSMGKWDLSWKPPGVSPVRYFNEIGLLHPKAVAVHMVRVEERDYPVLEQAKPNICLCIRSNERLRNGLPPVHDYLDMGMNLCLGTDGLGSNDDLSILNEMRHVKKRFPDLKDEAIVRMGTMGGAAALGLEEKFGALEPGKSSRLAVVDSGENAGDPYSFLVNKTPCPFPPGRSR